MTVVGTRAEKVAAIRGAIAAHPDWKRRQVADLLGMKLTTFHNLLNDPDGAKQAARRKRYQRPCPTCGTLMDGSGGLAFTPERCAACAAIDQHENRKWTRATVIDAIQRYAVIKGRPPIAPEWRKADLVNNYPAASTVYGSKLQGWIAPFRSWADAIEAAGFPRPHVGHREGQRWWTPALVLELIGEGSSDGVAPGSQNEPTLLTYAVKFFGSWNEACTIAGVASRSSLRKQRVRERIAA